MLHKKTEEFNGHTFFFPFGLCSKERGRLCFLKEKEFGLCFFKKKFGHCFKRVWALFKKNERTLFLKQRVWALLKK